MAKVRNVTYCIMQSTLPFSFYTIPVVLNCSGLGTHILIKSLTFILFKAIKFIPVKWASKHAYTMSS